MEERLPALFDEIHQLVNQYKQEVPGRRRAWPVSIKDRILEICTNGEMSLYEVANRSGIPYHTLLTWRFKDKKKAFKELAIVSVSPKPEPELKSATVTVMKRRRYQKSGQTITVTVGNGMKIEGLDLNGAVRIVKQLGGTNGDSI